MGVPIISVPDSNNCTKIPSAAGRSLVTILHIFLKLYIFGFSRRIFTMAKATGFKFGTVIDQVSTNQKTEVYPPEKVWPESHGF